MTVKQLAFTQANSFTSISHRLELVKSINFFYFKYRRFITKGYEKSLGRSERWKKRRSPERAGRAVLRAAALLHTNYRTYPKTAASKRTGYRIQKTRGGARLCIISGENANTTKEVSLVVFLCRWKLAKGSLWEGAGFCVAKDWGRARYNEVSTNLKSRRLLPPLRGPPSSRGRLLRSISLRIVGSGFCPIVRGHPRAMLAPDASVGKAEIQPKVELSQ